MASNRPGEMQRYRQGARRGFFQVSMASNRPGEMQLGRRRSKDLLPTFQWPQIGRVRCNGHP